MRTGSVAGKRFVLLSLFAAVVVAIAAVLIVVFSSSDSPTGPERGASDPARAASGDFWGDTSGIPAAQNVLVVKILNRTNGKYPDDQVFWSYNGQVHSIAEQPYFDMPANTSGRMYFHLGSPDSPYNDFIEFTVGPDVFNGNTTRVDAFGLKLAMRLRSHDGYDAQVGEDQQTFAESREATFQRFVDEVPDPFKQLARVEAPYRIPAPRTAAIFQPGGANENYFSAYAARHGVNATTSQIFGCSGPLAEAAARCAALNRHIAGNPESTWLDPSTFYPGGPANYYAKFWHDHAIGKLSYGFPYDDHANQSSFISHGDPQWLLVAVGW
ncbi:glycoside hydrolase family 64 protein [Actinocorallia sp. B10E7]|uniref:glycoside hydrolase family 64 protein n=1 Tax=Actinocorallia sp. B10E7 TaxID=3153558 RepID=UPI00325F3319